MKRVIAVNVILCLVLFIALPAYAGSLSTTQTIRLYLRVVSDEETEGSSNTVDMVSFDENKESDTPAPKLTNGAPQNYMSNPFSGVINAVKSVFLSFASPSKDMRRKY